MPRGEREPSAEAALRARIAALERENAELGARVDEITAAAARNDAVRRKTQERELDLLRAGSLAQLVEQLHAGLRSSFQLDAVCLVLHDPQHEKRHLLSGDGLVVESLQDVQFVDALLPLAPQLSMLERPWLGRYREADHALLTPRVRGLGSVALVPLRRGDQLDGVLVFGSRDPDRFSAGLASDFLAHLGLIAAICLENAVNRARLVRSGLTDFLTGFHNRRYLHARLREELARAQREKLSVVCLMIDVDHFKRINDQYGHLAGDAVLKVVAQRIDGEMRGSDTGARFGGDEFAIVLPRGGRRDGEAVAHRVLNSVRGTPVAIGTGVTETITLSIGVAVATPVSATRDLKSLAERLMADADAALYRAKSSGRNAVVVSDAVIA